MAEKGAFSLTLEVLTPGGHSSVPAQHTAIGILSLLLVELEKNRDKIEMKEGNPVLSFLQCAAQFGEMEHGLRKKVQDERKWNELGEELSQGDDVMRAFLSTTQAIDLVSGGIKVSLTTRFIKEERSLSSGEFFFCFGFKPLMNMTNDRSTPFPNKRLLQSTTESISTLPPLLPSPAFPLFSHPSSPPST